MIWTTDKPTKPGWWWVRENGYAWIVYTYLTNDGLYVSDDTGVIPLTDYDGEWAGPIPEPGEKV